MKKGIPDYERKVIHLWKKQGGRCAITGKLLRYDRKLDLHHVLAKKKWTRKLYRLYVNSIWNLLLVYHNAHVTKVLPKHPPEWQIRLAEGLLAQYPGIEYRMEMGDALKEYCKDFMR